MEATTSMLGNMGLSSIIFVILLFVALYYLYQFLFASYGYQGMTVLNSVRQANPSTPYSYDANSIPALYEGGEYTINTWVYINDYSIHRGYNKPILTLGGNNFKTLVVYLGPFKNSLQVRVHTAESTIAPTTGSSAPPLSSSTSSPTNLSSSVLTSMFGTLQNEGSLISSSAPCDVPSIDLQKWIQITICLNNKTCDVYLDGKLARSCVLPTFYKVDRTNTKLTLCDASGFGGFISNTSAYNYALNPEQVWRLYMSGPGPQYSFLDYLKSLFDPNALGALDYPKQNINA